MLVHEEVVRLVEEAQVTAVIGQDDSPYPCMICHEMLTHFKNHTHVRMLRPPYKQNTFDYIWPRYAFGYSTNRVNRKRNKMKNPFGEQPIPGSYYNLKERMYKKVSANVNAQILVSLQNAYEIALNSENVVLARAERKRLYKQVTRLVLVDIINSLDE